MKATMKSATLGAAAPRTEYGAPARYHGGWPRAAAEPP